VAINQVTQNKNFLSPTGYKFVLARAPNLVFNVQAVNFPGVTLGTTTVPTPFLMMPQTGKLSFEPLSVSFRVAEDLSDYLEIYNWITALGFPKDFAQYKSLSDNTENAPTGLHTLKSDLTLSILTSSLNKNIDIIFYDAFPSNISSMTFNTTDTNINYIEATIIFTYLRYEINKI